MQKLRVAAACKKKLQEGLGMKFGVLKARCLGHLKGGGIYKYYLGFGWKREREGNQWGDGKKERRTAATGVGEKRADGLAEK